MKRKFIQFFDFNDQRIVISYSSAAYDEQLYRLYVYDRENDDLMQGCLHLTKAQAKIIINGLKTLFIDDDD